MPAKSLKLGALDVPDEYFADFFRGCIDGDGSINVYTDDYNAFKNEKYVYTRLDVSLVSASPPFLEWIQQTVERLIGVDGGIFQKKVRLGRAPIYVLKYPKGDAMQLLKWMYYALDVPCLARKRERAEQFLEMDWLSLVNEYNLPTTLAEVSELADDMHSKCIALTGREGSSPSFGTTF